MPYNKTTGTPIHPAFNPDKAPGGRLLPINHPAWKSVAPYRVDSNVNLLAPQMVDKKKRDSTQPVSTVGFFALYASDKDIDRKSKYIGQGSFGKVKFAQSQDGKWFVVKTIAAPKRNSDVIRNEATILHQRGKLEAFYERSTPDRDGWNVYYLIQEWIDGEVLKNYHPTIRTFPLHVRIDEAMRFIAAINELNQQDIIHKDLNFGNVIRKHDGNYELIDFGQAQSADHSFERCDLTRGVSCLTTFFSNDEYSFLRDKIDEYMSRKAVPFLSEFFKAIHFGLEALKQFPNVPAERLKAKL